MNIRGLTLTCSDGHKQPESSFLQSEAWERELSRKAGDLERNRLENYSMKSCCAVGGSMLWGRGESWCISVGESP